MDKVERNTYMYNLIETGKRIRERRVLFGMSQDEIAEKIGRAVKYYADIERGYCGMSLQTMLALAECLDMSLDYMILGRTEKEGKEETEETSVLLHYFQQCSGQRRKYALQVLQVFLRACEETTDV